MKLEQITLTLFNAVLSKKNTAAAPIIDLEYGLAIPSDAAWALTDIRAHAKNKTLSGEELNKTFHKSWAKIRDTNRLELCVEQISHYLSTYGTGFTGPVYIPDEVLNVPELTELSLFLVGAMTEEELRLAALAMLQSGIALKQDTLNDLLYVLDAVGTTITSDVIDSVRNKEAKALLIDLSGVAPTDPVEALRYAVYKATSSTLLIKDADTVARLKHSAFNPSSLFESVGVEKMAEIFNRFKPLFLALKKQNPTLINRVAKLSKSKHKPLVQNPLNSVTTRLLEDGDVHWLDNATIYALFKAVSACHSRIEGRHNYVYRIRNGKSWAARDNALMTGFRQDVCRANFDILIEHLKKRLPHLKDMSVFLPQDIEYALPTSEKQFIGNVPTGTKFYGEELAAGVYWRNEWGAYDIDVSGQNIDGKIGWNDTYNMDDALLYSGDITYAEDGAVEYLWARRSKVPATLVRANIYEGDDQVEYKIVIGKGSDVTRDFMMDPNKVMADIKTQSVQKQTIIGLFMNELNGVSFTLINCGAGDARVGGDSESAQIATLAFKEQFTHNLTLNKLLHTLGVNVTQDPGEADVDLSINVLRKDTFLDLFSEPAKQEEAA